MEEYFHMFFQAIMVHKKYFHTPSLVMTRYYFMHCYVLFQFLYAKLNQWKQMKRGSLAFIRLIRYINLLEVKI